MTAAFFRFAGFVVGFAVIILTKWQFSVPIKNNLEVTYVTPPKILAKMLFGFQEQVADSMWIRGIQDLDYCSKKTGDHECESNGWLYQTLDLTTDISPKFRMVYALGTLSLSIIVGDKLGAELFFDKGIKEFPDDWPLLYRAAYHALYETNNRSKAADLLIRAGKAGGPPWVMSLAGRIYADDGKLELVEKLLEDMRKSDHDEVFIQRIEDKLARLKLEESTKKRAPAQRSETN